MQTRIEKNSKYIYLISLIAISWEIIDFILLFYINDIYYNMLKYAINITITLIFIILVNKYAIILFLELIPFVNLAPFFIAFALYSIIYVKYKLRKLHLQPVIDYAQVPVSDYDGRFCQNCGMKINIKTSTCPNCGFNLEEDLRFQCPICRGTKIEDSIRCPTCNTRFHKRCVLEWVKIKGSGPICKRAIDSSKI